MALEELLTKMTAALDANTAALKASMGAKPATAAASGKPTTTAKPPAIEFDVLKVAGTKVSDAKGRPFAKNLIKTVGGAADLTAVKPDKYPALMAAFEKALASEVEEAPAEDDDEL